MSKEELSRDAITKTIMDFYMQWFDQYSTECCHLTVNVVTYPFSVACDIRNDMNYQEWLAVHVPDFEAQLQKHLEGYLTGALIRISGGEND